MEVNRAIGDVALYMLWGKGASGSWGWVWSGCEGWGAVERGSSETHVGGWGGLSRNTS